MQTETNILFPIVEELKKKYPDLTNYQALKIAVEITRNDKIDYFTKDWESAPDSPLNKIASSISDVSSSLKDIANSLPQS